MGLLIAAAVGGVPGQFGRVGRRSGRRRRRAWSCRRARRCRSPWAGRSACRRGPSTDPLGPAWYWSTLKPSLVKVSSSGTNCCWVTNSGYFDRWLVNTSGASPATKPLVSLAPVVIPAELGDLDVDVRIGRLEVVRARLVGGLLIDVPQPVVDVAGGGAGVDRAAFGGPAFVYSPPPPPQAVRVRLRAATPTSAAAHFLRHSCHRWQILSSWSPRRGRRGTLVESERGTGVT